MKSLNEITNDIKSYAENLGLEGAYPDIISKIIAYGIYTKNAEIFPIITELSPIDSTKLNSKIFFSLLLGRSVFRGELPSVSYDSMISTVTDTHKEYKKLDYATSTNGYYLYFKDDIQATSNPVTLEFYITSNERLELVKDISEIESLSYIDWNIENISEDLVIRGEVFDENNNKSEIVTKDFTTSSIEFFSSNKHDYLVQTLPNYGIRIFKKPENSWGCNTLYVYALSYNETIPNNLNLVIPNYTKDADNIGNSYSVTYAQIREYDNDSIINNSLNYWSSRNTIASTSDLISNLYLLGSPSAEKYFSVQYKLGYVLLEYKYVEDNNEPLSKADIWAAYNNWTKTVEVNESMLIHEMEVMDQLIINVNVGPNDPITDSDLNNIMLKFPEYSGKSITNAWLVYEIMKCGVTRCQLTFGADYNDRKGLLDDGTEGYDSNHSKYDQFIYDIKLSSIDNGDGYLAEDKISHPLSGQGLSIPVSIYPNIKLILRR